MARLGPPLAPLTRAIVDYGHDLRRLDDARAVVAEAVRRGLCDLANLRQEVELGGRNGRAFIRRAVGEVAAGARSAPEARAAHLLAKAGLGPFEQNAVILVRGNRFIADFLWPTLMAILEIDSYEHHFAPTDWRRTMDRHLLLESAGYSVVHVPPSALARADDFLTRIRTWLQTCARRPPRLINSRSVAVRDAVAPSNAS